MMPLKFPFALVLAIALILMALVACGPSQPSADAAGADAEVSADTDAADLPEEVTGDTAGLPGDATGSDK
jgi:hypothetical protein